MPTANPKVLIVLTPEDMVRLQKLANVLKIKKSAVIRKLIRDESARRAA